MYSGFSYAHRHLAENESGNFIDHVEGFEEWPDQRKVGARHYCKTQTSLLYGRTNSRSEFVLLGWGWSAFDKYVKLLERSKKSGLDSKNFQYVTNFKLGLARSNWKPCTLPEEPYILPEGLSLQRVIADYLRELSVLIVDELKKKYGKHIGKKDIQWCLTVPAIWGDGAKQQMKNCAEVAGLVAGPRDLQGDASFHPIIIVLEPEAASLYCQHYLKKTDNTKLSPKSNFLIVDAGGGTVDLVFHERVKFTNQVKEFCSGSSGALCGATFVDDAFYNLLSRKIGCFKKFITEHPAAKIMINKNWQDLKVCFDEEPGPYVFWLSAQMGNYWEAHNRENGLHQDDSKYDEVKITLEEMKSVFDSVVDTILDLIERQLGQVRSEEVPAICIMVVGGFSGSPYLMRKIKLTFSERVKHIINPARPGKAVVTGAVVYGSLGKDFIISRISRKTYGVSMIRDFLPSDPQSYQIYGEDRKRRKCKNVFHVYTRNGDDVAVDHYEKREYAPLNRDCNSILLEVYSTSDSDPSYVTDFGVVKECTYNFAIPSVDIMEDIPKIEVSMFFGRTSIEVSAVSLNFKSNKVILPSVSFET